MQNKLSEVQVMPIKPKDGLVGFASVVYDDCLYLSGIGIYTRPNGSYRLTYPTRKSDSGSLNIFHPINRLISEEIKKAVILRLQEVAQEIYNMR